MRNLITTVLAFCTFAGIVNAGSISGRVTRQADGAPAAWIWVIAYDFDSGGWAGSGYTDSEGYYLLSGLGAGVYRVQAYDGSGVCMNEYYNDVYKWEDATPVTVREGEEIWGIHFELTEAARISGRVRRQSDGSPIAGAWVTAVNFETLDWGGGVYTDQDGYYMIGGLRAGVYCIAAHDDSGCLGAYYDNVWEWDAVTPVAAIPGEETSGIDFSLALAGRISGRITWESDGSPVSGIIVNVHRSTTGGGVTTVSTDENGGYVAGGLDTGSYHLYAYDPSGVYMPQYYNHVSNWAEAMPVTVAMGEETGGVDFSLSMAGSISGQVTRDSDGSPIPDVWIEVYDSDSGEWVDCALTDEEGNYMIAPLGSGTYHIQAYAYGTSYAGKWYDNVFSRHSAAAVIVIGGEDTAGINFSLSAGNTIHGTVVDKRTGLPVAGIEVGCWHEEHQLWRSAWTDALGEYVLTGVTPGELSMQVLVLSDSPYVRVGRDIFLVSDMWGVDFVLSPGATVSGRAVDAKTAEPIGGAYVDYWSERYAIWLSARTNDDGRFALTNLPPGMAEIEVDAWDESPYLWLSWPANYIYLEEGQEVSGQVIALRRGVLVRGYVKDTEGAGVAGAEVEFMGATYGLEVETDMDGAYALYLPAGTYAARLEFDDDESLAGQWASRAVYVTVDDSGEVQAPDIVAYSLETGGRISGTVVNTAGWGVRTPFVAALEAGTVITPETLAIVGEVCGAMPSETGEFVIPILPPGNYDIYLTGEDYDADDVGSFVIYDRILNAAVGSNVVLTASPGDGAMQGAVLNAAGQPILAATVFIADGSGAFAGGAESGPGGLWAAANMAAGAYTLTAIHPKYKAVEKTVVVADGLTAEVEAFVLPFAGGKEASDLNGDGVTDAGDLAVLAEQWLAPGDVEANFDQQGAVDLADLARMADLWRWQAMWTLSGEAL
ncbi:MAG: carboxypeptidase regulatory-like domain-containing protein [Phycisphaerae bacterium]|nr:carboxypeptidase regulatory-like domain-containing protein [Phycisphaerae bacterium]